MIVIKIASLLKLRRSRITSSSCSHNTRAELGLRVRDNTRAGFVKPRGSLSLSFIYLEKARQSFFSQTVEAKNMADF